MARALCSAVSQGSHCHLGEDSEAKDQLGRHVEYLYSKELKDLEQEQ